MLGITTILALYEKFEAFLLFLHSGTAEQSSLALEVSLQDSPGGSAIRNPLAMQEAWVRSLGREDLLEKEMATYSSILAWKILRTGYRGVWQATVHGVTRELDMT